MLGFSKNGKQAVIAIFLFAITAFGTFLIFQGRLINHDTAWFLVAVERWIEGGELYRDILEVNPPINFYFTLPANWLAKATGLTLSDAQYAVTSSMIGGVLGWCYLIVAREGREDIVRPLAFTMMIWAALVFPALKHFAQRDHLLVIFLMPWAIALVFREDGEYGRHAAIRGAFAALGICLKPYFLLFPILASVALMLRERSFRPLISASNISIVTVGAFYVGFVWFVHPAFFTEIVPIGMLTYGDYGLSNRLVILKIGPIQTFFLLLLLLACLRQRCATKGLGVIISLLLAGIFSYFFQWTGYAYQAIPAHSFGMMLCSFLILYSSEKTVLGTAFICFSVILAFSVMGGFYRTPNDKELVEVLSRNSSVHSITTLSSHVYVGPIVALELNAAWENRYPALWPVPGIVNANAEGECIRTETDCAALRQLAVRTRENVLDDLQKGKPDVIVFDKKAGYFDVPEFSYEEFLRKSEELSQFLDGYSRRESLDRFDILFRE